MSVAARTAPCGRQCGLQVCMELLPYPRPIMLGSPTVQSQLKDEGKFPDQGLVDEKGVFCVL